ncbi:hypothetical protein [Phytomonospora endophytica]|uniref:Uncharacterized protein n=1 Tax=Phytomonospora endophytica TaxID=714109 RepID=A0A841FM63_9ACTN|nr:hypothetical protein [Phytomonospora endophytica]MBB6034888.1 hypothetical protein [Phytomonospora endophytica]GIG70592.1 hypothetical protein Pen01_68870 [Phytomonospora endophytica]
MAKYTFTFTVDGTDLSTKQQAAIAQEVAEAGSRALNQFLAVDIDVVQVDTSRLRGWELIGRYAYTSHRAQEVAELLRGIK